MPLQTITTDDVRRMLEPIWRTKQETASRLRSRIEEVLSAAKAAGLREGENPARWRDNLKPFFGNMRKTVWHHAAVPYVEMPAFMVALRDRTSTSALALEFAVLTATRTSEVIGATWDEVDLQEKTWTIPGERMKAKKEHVVPLSERALALLAKTKRRKGLLVESTKKSEPLSNMAMLECLRDLRDGVPCMDSDHRSGIGLATKPPSRATWRKQRLRTRSVTKRKPRIAEVLR
jgi:integrase